MAKQPRSLAGKVVVITGGGRGIGAATAAALVGQGARVAIGDVDLETAEATAQRLGGGTLARHLDVTDHDGFTAFLDEVERELGPIDTLVNNAGIMPVVLADAEDQASIDRQIALNLTGVIHGTREAMRRFKGRGTGHIVNIASVAGKGGFPGVATYCATKHGVVGYSEAVRMELRGSGVDVSCVMPGIVRTELTAGVEDARFVPSLTPEQVADAIVAALRKPRFDVFVPRSTQYLTQVMSVMPRAVREGLARALKADTVMINADPAARAAYETRAAESTPAAEEEREPLTA